MLELSEDFQNGNVSFWFRDVPLSTRRPSLDSDIQVDVAIAGGGMTGLWLSYYLASADPTLNIGIFEKEFVGYGASGRNGGWLSGEPPGQLRRYAKDRGWGAAIKLQQEVFSTIDEVHRVLNKEGVDADFVKSGLMYAATSPAQFKRLQEHVKHLHTQGWSEQDIDVLSADEVFAEVAVDGVQGGYWTPHCARIHPAKLVRGLAGAVERLGVTIFEGTEVEELAARKLVTKSGTVAARVVVNALEGYQVGLRGLRRRVLPMNSSMIVTEPLSEDAWRDIGWSDSRLLGDHAHSYAYCQRTRDGRIAIGGRGVPYSFASRFDVSGKTPDVTIKQLKSHLDELLPAARSARIDHAWSGILGVPRDWTASVTFDPQTGLASSGGYTGHGVAGTNLGARTLADLILGRDTDCARLPWVDRTSRNWEPEPVRWLGARSLYIAYRYADRKEKAGKSAKTDPVAKVADRVSGRH